VTGAATLKVKLALEELDGLVLSTAVTVNVVAGIVCDGVPLIAPVVESNDIPAGSTGEIENVREPFPPLVDIGINTAALDPEVRETDAN
jgi:hypothetical protein